MDVNFEYYKVFYYVAKYQNFTKAAKVLGSSQPNITREMNCLEEETGCTLFIRTNRGVRLTPEGESLYAHVSAAMGQFQAAEDEMAENLSLEHGSIAIGASETALNIFLLDHLKAFHLEYPGIRLKIFNHSTPQAVQAAENGEIDFAVVTTPTTAEPPLSEVRLMPFREILIGGKTFTALGSQELTLSELSGYPLIGMGQESMTWRFYHDFFLAHRLDYAPDTEAATTDQILPLVKSELGLAFLPEPMAKDALARNEIVQIKLREKVPERMVCLVYDRKRPLSAAVQRLKGLITGQKS